MQQTSIHQHLPRVDLLSLKSDVFDLDINDLKTVPADLYKQYNVAKK